jgi:hypothetical protein
MKAGGKSDGEVTSFRHTLVEFDEDQNDDAIPKEIQYGLLITSGMPIGAVLDSGNRSIHALVSVDAPDRQEYDRRVTIVHNHFRSHNLDLKNKNPSRYSRCPGVDRKLYGKDGEFLGTGRQELLAVNIGAASWDKWEQANFPQAESTEEIKRRAEALYGEDADTFPKPMREEAFLGIAGEIVSIIEPQSESSREAILAQFLIGFGNLIGRGPSRDQSAEHHLNEFGAIVGDTSKGRKGTGWVAVERLLLKIDPEWGAKRIIMGIQSGEAVVWCVRDPREIPIKGRKKSITGDPQKYYDPGIEDKRALFLEEELSRLLCVKGRIGNSVSETLRSAWDGRRHLSTTGKIDPQTATDAHISLIGHITREELKQNMKAVDFQNGFANRFFWVASRRTKRLAIPKPIDWRRYPTILAALANVLETFRNKDIPSRELSYSAEGAEAWEKFYNSIEDGQGVLASVLARAEPHVLRLAMLYTVLDNSTLITDKHIEAAVAFWDYCADSARWTFNHTTGNGLADDILWGLRRSPGGLTKTEISERISSRNYDSTQLSRALAALRQGKLADFKIETPQKGRPAERWFAK